jgi:hypothetical protein
MAPHLVIPAKAGTHRPVQEAERLSDGDIFVCVAPMGPGFRRDDEFFERNATPEEYCLVHPIALRVETMLLKRCMEVN